MLKVTIAKKILYKGSSRLIFFSNRLKAPPRVVLLYPSFSSSNQTPKKCHRAIEPLLGLHLSLNLKRIWWKSELTFVEVGIWFCQDVPLALCTIFKKMARLEKKTKDISSSFSFWD